jgi:hypothetical protein
LPKPTKNDSFTGSRSLLSSNYFAAALALTAFFALSQRDLNPSGSLMAISESILRLIFTPRLVESIDETAVADAIDLAGSRDTTDPKFAEVTLRGATRNVGVVIAVEQLLFGGLEEDVFAAEIAFRPASNLLATGVGDGPTFNSCHVVMLLYLFL